MADEIHQGVSEAVGAAKRQGMAIASAASAASARSRPKGGSGAKKRTSAASTVAKRPKAAKKSTKKKPAAEEIAADDESMPISRKELLEKALRAVATDLEAKGAKRPTNTIGNLVQLLKLDRSCREDEEQPHEIRVVWEEKQDETLDDLPERRSESSPRA